MSTREPQRFKRVRLMAMPWPIFKRPSIQLGSLKSYLDRHMATVRVDTTHIYLRVAAAIGYERYQAISKRTWLAESVYAALIHPERFDAIEQLFRKAAKKEKALQHLDFQEIIKTTQHATDEALQALDWQGIDLLGLSICLCQLTATLYAAKQIKRLSPDIVVVVGGSTVSNPFCRQYLDVFDDFDIIVNGEGELPLRRILEHFEKGESVENAGQICGVVTRQSSADAGQTLLQLPNLDQLATPDYDEYFDALGRLPSEKRFFATLPIESSRGCWWQAGSLAGRSGGCAFCNLNLQWQGYRQKKAKQVVRDIAALTDRHQLLSVAFMDNVLPSGSAPDVFQGLSRLDMDLRIFAEVRASTPLKALASMHAAGMVEVQVGIESLSSTLLKKIHKGTTAIQNMEIMKNCEALGIKNVSNLMLHFPGSDDEDVAETLRAIELAMVFRPLRPVSFWLGLGSPVWQASRKFQIHAVSNHPNYGVLFPEPVASNVSFPILTYKGDRMHQKKLWKPVEEKIRDWEQLYERLRQEEPGRPILSFQDGGTFLLIRQRRLGEAPLQHRLTGTSRKIYLFCQTARSLRRILLQFPEFSENKLLTFLRMMIRKRLMYEDSKRFLSLAVRENLSARHTQEMNTQRY